MSDWIEKIMENCRLCPRECGVNRSAGRRGLCGADDRIRVARAALHYWEEPCISGEKGSGAVFFSGCSLGCIFCQNAEISGIRTGSAGQRGRELPGKTVTVERMADLFLRLQDEEQALNINLVTASHYIPQTVEALSRAKSRGLRVPVIYNSSGYEKASSLQLLEGLVDVYLPDFKYITSALARQYSGAEDYPERAKEALCEMARQVGSIRMDPESGLVKRGVIVRHLLLPGHVTEAKKVVSYLHTTYGDDISISLMNQYTPMAAAAEDPLLRRKVTRREYDRLVEYALKIGVKNGFIQEGGTAQESFIPSFNGEGV